MTKALGDEEAAVHFRPVPHLPRGMQDPPQPNVLRFGLEPAELPAYGRLLLNVLNRDPALSIRGDEAEESWRVVTPVLAAWAKDFVPLQEDGAGSDGPTDGREG